MLRPQLERPDGLYLLAEFEGAPAGFVAATIVAGSEGVCKGCLSLLMVHHRYQRKGVGSALHHTALDFYRDQNIDEIMLGAGSPGFWQGVPFNLPDAAAFFQRQGWTMGGRSIDMVQHLHGYRMPGEIRTRKGLENIALRPVTPSETPEMLDFVRREFPGWLGVYQGIAELGDLQDIVIGRENDGPIIASIIIYTSASHPSRTDVLWTEVLGADAGAFGCVGVAESERGRGLGLLLVGVASEILSLRGVGNGFVHWTHLESFYARAGYTTWREYSMCRRGLVFRGNR